MLTKRTTRIRDMVLVAALVPALGGCAILGIGGNGKMARDATLRERLADDFGAQQLAAGRKALTDGHVADAIESFQLASLYPEQAAAAANGLAVAWSRAGRADLTERYFQAAVALAPQEDKYRSNLAMFYSRNPIQREAYPGAALVALQDAMPLEIRTETVADQRVAVVERAPEVRAPQIRSLGGGITVATGSSHLRRISPAEVAITSEPAPARPRARQAVIEVGARPQPAAAPRVTVVSAQPAKRSAYPVRIELSRD